jgi:hypothetical protein
LGDQELQHRYNPTPTSVVMVDVDGLKAVNDGSGHAAGDELLRRCARLLAESVRATDVAARIGGDEFGVLVRHTNVEQAQGWLERLNASRVGCSDEGPLLHWSIGCASAEFPRDDRSGGRSRRPGDVRDEVPQPGRAALAKRERESLTTRRPRSRSASRLRLSRCSRTRSVAPGLMANPPRHIPGPRGGRRDERGLTGRSTAGRQGPTRDGSTAPCPRRFGRDRVPWHQRGRSAAALLSSGAGGTAGCRLRVRGARALAVAANTDAGVSPCRLARSTRSSHQPTTLSTLARGGHDVLGDVVLMVRRGARRSLASWVLGVRGQCR